MEPDPLLSALSTEEREELCLAIVDQLNAREGRASGDPSRRRMILNILRKLGLTPETIRGLAEEAHVDLAPLVERIRDQGVPKATT
jgi:hypothetical protein